jgi:hypothetical protein
MDFLELLEGFRRTGRKGGVVVVLLGAVFLAGGLSLAKDAKDERRHRRHQGREVGVIALMIVLGGGAVLAGLNLIVTGGSSRNEPPVREDPEDPLDPVPLPYALCLQCPRVVKNWNATACSRCGGDLVDIRSEEDEQWARQTLATRASGPAARAPASKAPSASRRVK